MKVFVHTDAFPYAECMPCSAQGANGMVHVPALQCPISVEGTLGVFNDAEAEKYIEALKQLRVQFSFARQKYERSAAALKAKIAMKDPNVEEEP